MIDTIHHLTFSADLELNAKTHMPCPECGAPIGQGCVDIRTGLDCRVHSNRMRNYKYWFRQYDKVYRTEMEKRRQK